MKVSQCIVYNFCYLGDWNICAFRFLVHLEKVHFALFCRQSFLADPKAVEVVTQQNVTYLDLFSTLFRIDG